MRPAAGEPDLHALRHGLERRERELEGRAAAREAPALTVVRDIVEGRADLARVRVPLQVDVVERLYGSGQSRVQCMWGMAHVVAGPVARVARRGDDEEASCEGDGRLSGAARGEK